MITGPKIVDKSLFSGSRELFSNIKGFLKIRWFGCIETFSFDADVATIAMGARPGELLFYGEGTVKKSRD